MWLLISIGANHSVKSASGTWAGELKVGLFCWVFLIEGKTSWYSQHSWKSSTTWFLEPVELIPSRTSSIWLGIAFCLPVHKTSHNTGKRGTEMSFLFHFRYRLLPAVPSYANDTSDGKMHPLVPSQTRDWSTAAGFAASFCLAWCGPRCWGKILLCLKQLSGSNLFPEGKFIWEMSSGENAKNSVKILKYRVMTLKVRKDV